MQPATQIRKAPGSVETAVGNEIVLMSLAAGECYGLGETGSAIWRLLPATFADLIAGLANEYEAPAHILEHDTTELLEDLSRRKLVTLEFAD